MYLYGENAEKLFSANVLKTKAETYNVSLNYLNFLVTIKILSPGDYVPLSLG